MSILKGKKKMMMLGMSICMTAGMICGCGQQQDTSVVDIQSRGVFRVAIPTYDTNMLYYDETVQDYRGTEAEVIDIITQSLGTDVEFIPVADEEMITAIDTGNCDMAIGRIASDDARIAGYGVTTSYDTACLYWVTPRGIYAGDISVFKGQDVGVSSEISSSSYVDLNYVDDIAIYEYEDTESAELSLGNGEIEGYLCYKDEAEYMVSKNTDLQIQNASGLPRESYVMVTKPEYAALIDGCNNLIREYVEGNLETSWAQEENQKREEQEMQENSKLLK